MKFKRIVAGGVAGVAALTLSTLVPAEANANVIDGCATGEFCAWEDSMYSGHLQKDTLTNSSAKYTFGVSSYWNRTNKAVCISMRGHAKPALYAVPGQQSAVLDDGWNDNIDTVIPAEDTPGGSCFGW